MKKSLLLTLVFLVLTLTASLAFSQVDGTSPCKDPAVAAARRSFATMDGPTKVAVWQAHLQKQLDSRLLNQSQRDTIADAARLLTTEFYQTDKSATAWQTGDNGKAWAKLRHDMKANFSAKDGAAIFERLDLATAQQVMGASAYAKVFKPTSLLVRSPIDCSCSTTWTFCDEGGCSRSCGACGSCTQVINCGPFWGFPCNGLCSGHLGGFEDTPDGY